MSWGMSTKDQLLSAALHGTAMRYAAERRNLPESIAELREIAGGRDDILAEGVTADRVWRLTKTDQEWSHALEEALTATRRTDLKHGSNAAYKHGCVCKDCREHQRQRMAKN